MNLYYIQKELDKLIDDLREIKDRASRLYIAVYEEIKRQETVELRLITKRRRGRSASTPLTPFPSGIDRNPTLYDKMVENGYSLEEIKKLFGENTHVMAKIRFGRQRFTAEEAEKLSELFHLSEKERGVFFWRGIIETTPR